MSEKPIPFPALTPAQRLHIDIHGYVIIKNLLTQSEIDTLKDTLYGIEDDFRRTNELPSPYSWNISTTEEFFRVDNLPHLAPCFFDYISHPYILGMAEEIIGGPARLEQSDAHIRRPVADKNRPIGFHRTINSAYNHNDKGLYHYSFIKALTNLTDLGPDDGGTTVIPGTHKIPIDIPDEEIINAAMDDPSFIQQVEAPAGSTLLFFESLIHSAGNIKSDQDRLLILGGYAPTMFQTWKGYDPDPDFVKTLSDKHRALLTGEDKYSWKRKARDLATPAETYSVNSEQQSGIVQGQRSKEGK